MKRKVLTDDELNALLAVDLDSMDQQNRRWFWIRTSLCLAYIVAMVLALLLFPDRIFAKFNLPDESAPIITGSYVQIRLAVILTATVLYLASYYWDRYFQYVALAAVLIAIGNFVNDYFTIYIYTKPESVGAVYLISACRVLLILLLYANFRFAVKRTDIRYRAG